MINNIEEQAKYYSFVLCQVTSVEIAQKFPHHILSVNNQLKYTDEQKNQEGQANQLLGNLDEDKTNIEKLNKNSFTSPNQYNYSVDAVSYRISGKRIILSQGKWLKNAMKSQDLNKLSQQKIFVPYQCLQIANNKQINFYYYSGQVTATFIRILPKYFVNQNCIIFQLEDNLSGTQLTQIQKILSPAKAIDYSCKFNLENIKSVLNSNNFETNFYNFKSDYALMSDSHFLNCFVQGKKQIGSYLKVQFRDSFQSIEKQGYYKLDKQSYFLWWIDPNILKSLNMIYMSPKL